MFDNSAMLEAEFAENMWLVLLIYGALIAAGILTAFVVGFRMARCPPDWSARVAAIVARPWTLYDGGIVVIGLLSLQLVLLVLQWFLGEMNTFFLLTLNTLFFHIAGLIMIASSLRSRKLSWKTGFGLEPGGVASRLGTGAVSYLAILPFLLFAAMAYQLVLWSIDYPPSLQDIAEILKQADSIGMRAFIFILAVVIAPVFEEILFRGVGLPLVAKKLGMGPAVFLTSFAFAFIHFHVPSFIPLFLIAVAFSMAYIYSRSILVPIVMHAAFNGVNLGMLWLMK